MPTRNKSIDVGVPRLSRSFRRQRSCVCSWRQLQVHGELGRDSACGKERSSVFGPLGEETPFHGRVLLSRGSFVDSSDRGGVRV